MIPLSRPILIAGLPSGATLPRIPLPIIVLIIPFWPLSKEPTQRILKLLLSLKHRVPPACIATAAGSLSFATTAVPKSPFQSFPAMVSYSLLFSQFAGLGINTVTIKLFPYFRDYEHKHHGYLGLALLISFVGLIISVSAFILLKSSILGGGKEGSDLFAKYFYYVVPLIIFTLLFNVFDTYYRVLYNAVKGIIYKEVIQRVLILIVIIL